MAALFALIAACSPMQRAAMQGPSSLMVAPDDGMGALRSLLASAEVSIDVMVYLLSSEEITEELAAAQQRGVRVRVLLEENPVGGGAGNSNSRQRLAAAGVAVRWTDPTYRFTHAKLILLDGARAVIMTANLTPSSLRTNREFAVIVEGPATVEALGTLFQSDWDRAPLPDVDLPLVVSPENARSALHNLIAGARQSLELYVLSLEDDAIAAALAAAAERGVRVRMITNPPRGGDSYADERALLRAQGGIVGFLDYPDVHAKVVIADGQRAFVGSQNLTATSLDRNREVGIIVDDPAVLRRLLQTFEADWAQVTIESSTTLYAALAA